MTISNTLTGLSGSIYAALDITSNEIVGLANSVYVDRIGAISRARVGQSAQVPVTTSNSAADIAEAMTAPEPAGKTVNYVNVTVSRAKASAFGYTGEDVQGLDNSGLYASLQTQEIAQAIRTLRNLVEIDLASLYVKSSRAYGAAGTTPFASDLTDSAYIRKILVDNGAPVEGGWALTVDTAAGAKLRSLGQLTKANEAGSTEVLLSGSLMGVHGGKFSESAQIKLHTKGTASSATTNTAGYAIGATTITLASAGTGTIVAGDVVTFAGDTNKYLVTTGDTDVSNGGTIVLAAPGLRQAIPASATAITVGNNYTANMAFTPNAIVLAPRMPALPKEGDAAIDRMTVQDPRSGIAYEFAIYPGYRQNRYEVSLAWGYEMIKPEHTAILLG